MNGKHARQKKTPHPLGLPIMPSPMLNPRPALLLPLALSTVALVLTCLGNPAVALPSAQPAGAAPSTPLQSGKPDTIYRRNERTGRVIALSGIVLENSLTQVKLDRNGKTASYDAASIVRIDWGSVPPSYRDGMTYRRRSDWAQAVTSFRIAATDASTRNVLQADARLQACEALLRYGASDPGQFAEAVKEADRLTTDFASSSLVPRARAIQARALRLTGDDAAAATAFESLYGEGASDPATSGYDRQACLRAGLQAAWCHLEAGDSVRARELFGATKGALEGLAAGLSGGDPQVLTRLVDLAGEAAMGEGFCLLAGGDASSALAFFERTTARSDAAPGARYAALLGRGEALLALEKLRDAQLCFAEVAALEHTNPDRAARAVLGLAQTTLALGDGDAAGAARRWLTVISDSYGDTPSARKALDLQGNL